MIAENQQFFIDILRFIPFDAELLIQSPHDEVLSVLETMNASNDGAYKKINLSKENRQKLIFEILFDDIEEYMHNIQIKINNQLIFNGYDGIEYGTFSKHFKLPKDFYEEYKEKEMINISLEW